MVGVGVGGLIVARMQYRLRAMAQLRKLALSIQVPSTAAGRPTETELLLL